MVGAGPAYPPTHIKFDPYRLPRIQALAWSGPDDKNGSYGSEYWLNYFRRHPEERYVSDGDPKAVTFPKDKSGFLRKEFQTGKSVKVY